MSEVPLYSKPESRNRQVDKLKKAEKELTDLKTSSSETKKTLEASLAATEKKAKVCNPQTLMAHVRKSRPCLFDKCP